MRLIRPITAELTWSLTSSLTHKASWQSATRSRSVAQVVCARPPRMRWGIQVKLVVAAAACSGSGCRCHGYHAGCCRKGPRRQRITTAWGIGSCWVDWKAVATQRDRELQPITARRVTMHNASQRAAVFLICKLRWNIYLCSSLIHLCSGLSEH